MQLPVAGAGIQSIWGTRFPADYMAFMSRYGTGSINGDAGVFSPLVGVEAAVSIRAIRWNRPCGGPPHRCTPRASRSFRTTERYTAFDNLIDALPKQPPPSEAFDALLAVATDDEAIDLAERAWSGAASPQPAPPGSVRPTTPAASAASTS